MAGPLSLFTVNGFSSLIWLIFLPVDCNNLKFVQKNFYNFHILNTQKTIQQYLLRINALLVQWHTHKYLQHEKQNINGVRLSRILTKAYFWYFSWYSVSEDALRHVRRKSGHSRRKGSKEITRFSPQNRGQWQRKSREFFYKFIIFSVFPKLGFLQVNSKTDEIETFTSLFGSMISYIRQDVFLH